ncbi:MAG: hypothetical protein WBA88_02335 [Pseudaminobacter sp.]
MVLVAAADAGLRHSLEFVLKSAGFRVDSHLYTLDAFASLYARRAICAVVDDNAIDNWTQASEQFNNFAKPVILLVSLFRPAPDMPCVTPLMKPFLGEPLIDAVRKISAAPHD